MHPRRLLPAHCTPLLLASLAAALPALAAADSTRLSVSGSRAPITEVTLYPGIAAVQREARIEAQTRQLSFECLPASVDAQSLQITSDEGVRIGEIKTLMQARHMAKDCASPLHQQIRTLEDQLAAIEAEENAAKLVGEFLQGVSKPGDEARISAAQIASTSQALRQSSRDNSVRTHQIQRQKQDLLTQLQPLREDRDRTGAQQAQVMKVTVQLASARAANVRLSYQVRGPSWQPSYRAQLSTVKSQVQLERQALVVQASGEDWSNVSLRLSTGQPTRSTQGALPRPWVVDVVQPRTPEAPAPAPLARASRTVEKKMNAEIAMAPALPELDVSSIDTAYATQFVVPYKITVPSSSERITLSLGQERLGTSLLTRTAPAMEEAAYLIATLQAPPGIWPAGPVTLFRDDALVGTGRLDFGNAQALAQGLSFGRDDKVVVRRLPAQNNTGSSGWASSKTERTIVRSYAVENRHDSAIALQVLDASPTSSNEQIKVQSQFSPTPSTTRWNAQNGMIAWEQNLGAGATAQFQATHQIRFPENLPIQGLQ